MFDYPRFQNFADSLLNILMPAPTPDQRRAYTDLVHQFERTRWNAGLFEQAVQEVGEPFVVTKKATQASRRAVADVLKRYFELNPVELEEEEANN